jgi:hypothetical protein
VLRRMQRRMERSSYEVCASFTHKRLEVSERTIVMGVKGIHVPLPSQPTGMTCTLNNGIHFVTTPEFQLSDQCPIEQEFEL